MKAEEIPIGEEDSESEEYESEPEEDEEGEEATTAESQVVEMLNTLEYTMEEQLLKTKGVTKKNHKDMPSGEELKHFHAVLLGHGEGDLKNQWPKQPMEVHMSQKEESAIKELIIMGFAKEDFEAGARLTECICKEWKNYGDKAGEACVLANRTFGVQFQGKKRREVLMKMLALLVARRDRLIATGVTTL